MSKILKFFKNLIYSIPFGLKGGDLVLSQKTSVNSDNTNVINYMTSDNLGEKLLKGELTQEVEELRYMTYKVSEESKRYKYIGDGQSVKMNSKNKNFNNFSFSFDNKIVCNGVLEELNHVGGYGMESYTISVITNVIPRFKIEALCTKVDVSVKDGMLEISLHFSKYPNKYNPLTKRFILELENIKTNFNDYIVKNHEICSSIQQLSFVTFNVENEEDGFLYTFNDLKCLQIVEEEHEYIVKYRPSYFKYENLIEKFKSESLEKKYETNAPKSKTAMFEVPINVNDSKCSRCGKEISDIYSQATNDIFGESLCVECASDEDIEKYVDKTELMTII